jgi:DNA-nicking Smr family endonuclease
MKRPLRPEEVKVWVEVAKTVDPKPGRTLPELPPEAPPLEPGPKAALPAPTPTRRRTHAAPPEHIEPGRKRRLIRERDDIDARVDLHGMTFERARATLHAFLHRAHRDGARAVLVITGKGGEGILKRHTPEWLAEPEVRAKVAGVSQAHRKHGGEGALYVALKRAR